MYIYQSHMSGLFTSNRELDTEECYCETCGDFDFLIGEADTWDEAWDLLKDDTNIDGTGGWDYEYIQEFLNENFRGIE